MEYDSLPSWFMAFDLYDGEKFVDPGVARVVLHKAGFVTVPILHTGKVESYEWLEKLANEETTFARGQKREGLYIKVSDGTQVTHRFKMVREGFEQGALWDKEKIKKNALLK